MLNKNNIPLVRGLGGGLGGKAGGLSTFRLIVSDGPVGAHSAYCPAALAGPALFPHEQATWYWKKIERWFQEFYCDITIVLFFSNRLYFVEIAGNGSSRCRRRVTISTRASTRHHKRCNLFCSENKNIFFINR